MRSSGLQFTKQGTDLLIYCSFHPVLSQGQQLPVKFIFSQAWLPGPLTLPILLQWTHLYSNLLKTTSCIKLVFYYVLLLSSISSLKKEQFYVNCIHIYRYRGFLLRSDLSNYNKKKTLRSLDDYNRQKRVIVLYRLEYLHLKYSSTVFSESTPQFNWSNDTVHLLTYSPY